MKIVNRFFQFLAIALALGALVLFFFRFVIVWTMNGNVELPGALAAFGGTKEFLGETYKIAKSERLLLAFITTFLSAVLSVATLKYKKPRFVAPVMGLISAILLLVIYCKPFGHIDTRALPGVIYHGAHSSRYMLLASIVLFVYTAVAIVYLLIDDHLEVVASKGQKLSIPRRIIRFFRDYKSEIKKIVWPGPKDVIKNTVIVLLMCLLVGILIWAIDYGLGQLLTRILTSSAGR